jgi:hypothetical protein
MISKRSKKDQRNIKKKKGLPDWENITMWRVSYLYTSQRLYEMQLISNM